MAHMRIYSNKPGILELLQLLLGWSRLVGAVIWQYLKTHRFFMYNLLQLVYAGSKKLRRWRKNVYIILKFLFIIFISHKDTGRQSYANTWGGEGIKLSPKHFTVPKQRTYSSSCQVHLAHICPEDLPHEYGAWSLKIFPTLIQPLSLKCVKPSLSFSPSHPPSYYVLVAIL